MLMAEPINVKINLMVTPTIWKFLEAKENYSEYIRKLIEVDLKKPVRRKERRLDV